MNLYLLFLISEKKITYNFFNIHSNSQIKTILNFEKDQCSQNWYKNILYFEIYFTYFIFIFDLLGDNSSSHLMILIGYAKTTAFSVLFIIGQVMDIVLVRRGNGRVGDTKSNMGVCPFIYKWAHAITFSMTLLITRPIYLMFKIGGTTMFLVSDYIYFRFFIVHCSMKQTN